MTRPRHRSIQGLFVAAVLLPLAAAASDPGLVHCGEWQDRETQRLRDLVRSSSHTLPADPVAGVHQIRYLVIAPDTPTVATANNAIVFFNGTSGIMSDWPYHMIKGPHGGLCDDYTLIFFDYPGVGLTPEVRDEEFTLTGIARDVDALITYVSDRHRTAIGTRIDAVHPLGWSLGSRTASKFAGLAVANGYGENGDRTIGNLFLIATEGGGDVQSDPDCVHGCLPPPVTGNTSECVMRLFDTLRAPASYTDTLKGPTLGLTFSYVYLDGELQAPYTGDNNEICHADVLYPPHSSVPFGLALTDRSHLPERPIETSCQAHASIVACGAEVEYGLNRSLWPYLDDRGISNFVYNQERKMSGDADYSYCLEAGAGWTQHGCHGNPHRPLTNLSSGGLCKTTGLAKNQPWVGPCMPLDHITGQLIVMNGEYDLFVQAIYGERLVEEYQKEHYGVAARYERYPCAAGHAVLLSDPPWVRRILVEAMGDHVRDHH